METMVLTRPLVEPLAMPFPTRLLGKTDVLLEEAVQLPHWWVEPITEFDLLPDFAKARLDFALEHFGSMIDQVWLYHENPPLWKRTAYQISYYARSTITNVKEAWAKITGSKLLHEILHGLLIAVGILAGIAVALVVLAAVAAVAAIPAAIGLGIAGMFQDPVLAVVMKSGQIVELARWV